MANNRRQTAVCFTLFLLQHSRLIKPIKLRVFYSLKDDKARCAETGDSFLKMFKQLAENLAPCTRRGEKTTRYPGRCGNSAPPCDAVTSCFSDMKWDFRFCAFIGSALCESPSKTVLTFIFYLFSHSHLFTSSYIIKNFGYFFFVFTFRMFYMNLFVHVYILCILSIYFICFEVKLFKEPSCFAL